MRVLQHSNCAKKMREIKKTLERLAGGEKVALWGRGASTASVEKLFAKAGIECVYYSDNPTDKKFDFGAAKKHRLAVYSPAFQSSNKFFEAAKAENVATLGEPDIAGKCWKGKIVAISGTNGKTTLTSFLTLALNNAGFNAISAGNIGTPLCEFVESECETRTAVLELSSFQTMRLKYLHPDAYIWTNFAPDHLDWHKDMREYFLAKLNLAKMLKKDIFIAGKSVYDFAKSEGIKLPDFLKIAEKSQAENPPPPFDNSIQSENFAMAKAFWKVWSLDEQILGNSAKSFSLSKFRFAKTAEIGKVGFWNDSKATNAHAAIAALRELKGKKVFWIGGGKNKNCDLKELAQTVRECANGACLIGQTAEILKNEIKSLKNGIFTCQTLEEAVKIAFEKSKNGGNVLFSPSFSSFGMFKNYAERGRAFDAEVLKLKEFQHNNIK